VAFSGPLGDEELSCDLLVGETLGDELSDLALTTGKCRPRLKRGNKFNLECSPLGGGLKVERETGSNAPSTKPSVQFIYRLGSSVEV
jgi:hypothetical protein